MTKRLTEKLTQPGEHAFLFPALVGNIEMILTVPEGNLVNHAAFIGHPHSLYGGTMENKVVTTLARAFKELNIPSLRFNFRGVGRTEGQFNEGIGESEDLLFLAETWQKEQAHSRFIFAGFSFGSYVAYRAAAQLDAEFLLTVAPPVHHFDYNEFEPEPNPWVIFQGDEDEVVPFERVQKFAQKHSLIKLIDFEETGHFFHGKLTDLKSETLSVLRQLLFNATS